VSSTDGRDAPLVTYLVAAVLAALAGFGTIYLSFAPTSNGRLLPPAAETPGETPVLSLSGAGAGLLKGLNKGAMAAFLVWPQPKPVPELAITDANDASKILADFRGKVVLLNIWATWCHPCREEMPTLDKLQAALGGKDFEVVAVNIDKAGDEKAKDFLRERGAEHLALYTDPSDRLFVALKSVGMPTSILIDRDGREVGRLVGPADWNSPEAVALMKAVIAAPGARREPGAGASSF
jgi:thiol-disulfide isomerase/thioredoxin